MIDGMTDALVVVSSALLLVATVPYVVDVIKGKTKPRIVSWFTWGLLGAITATASLTDHQYPAGVMSLLSCFGCFFIMALGWKHGDRKFERVDVICQVSALVGIGLWLMFDSPAVAVIAVIVIDLIGSVPTLIHSWHQPHEETWITFFLSGLAAVFTLFAAENHQITAIANPIYIALINALLVGVIVGRHKHAVKGMPSELKEL
jgi:hypothetical protein